MKRLNSSLAAKITAVVLACVFSVMLTVNAVVLLYLVRNDAFTSRQEFLHSSISIDQENYEQIEEYYEAYIRGDSNVAEYYKNEFSEQNSNLFFKVRSEDDKYPSLSNYFVSDYMYSQRVHTDYDVTEPEVVNEVLAFQSAPDRWSYISDCQSNYYNVQYTTADEDMDGDGDFECTLQISYEVRNTVPVFVTAYLRSSPEADDGYSSAIVWSNRLYEFRFGFVVIAALSVVALIVIYIYLICAAGHKHGCDGITLNWIDRIPFDLYLAVLAMFTFFLIMLAYSVMYHYMAFMFIVLTVPWSFILTSLVMTFSSRVKAGAWWRNTLVFRLLGFIKCLLRKGVSGLVKLSKVMPLVWGMVLGWVGLAVIELLAFAFLYEKVEIFIYWIILKVLLTPAVMYIAWCLAKLQEGSRRIALGEADYKVDTSGMRIPAICEHGKNLNNIAHGIQLAVEEKMKSERLKTELITNVSHDIKTPLTSIVNYSGLLRDSIDNTEKANEYIDIIERHSARLRKLIDDLVEASKASTGNIKPQLQRTDINVLLSQSCGEYAERLQNAGIDPVLDFCTPDPFVMADGRLLWRVFDNLLCNVCKYAQEGTRLYVSSVKAEDRVVLTFKNISGMPLNISGDELMERFVRGDTSRSTEGSGLGLSIAGSLVSLQGGVFSIEVDGDLFKAKITLPVC